MDEMKPVDSGAVLRQRQCLSALADGEALGEELAAACAAWRDDAERRADWHAYALIGDVLRSEDLSRSADADAAFLARLRERMASEPVVLAPAEAVKAAAPATAMPELVRRRTWGGQWGAPMAVAAGALTVIGVAAVMRGVAMPEADTAVAVVPVASVVATSEAAPARQVHALVANGELASASFANDMVASPADVAASAFVHDPNIDRYLNAHRQYARGLVLAAPGGLRQVAASPNGR